MKGYFQDEITQKDLATKTHLCTESLIVNNRANVEKIVEKIYDNLIPTLSKPENQQV